LFANDGQEWSNLRTRAVVLKALLAHGCGWQDTGPLLNAVFPPPESGRWARRREAITRFIGYGRIDCSRVFTGDGSRVTLLADDLIGNEQLHEYRIPIPRAMIANREVRRIVMTLAWSSPIDPASTRYRGYQLDIVDEDGKYDFWDGVGKIAQPGAFAGRRGTLQHLVFEGTKMMRSVGTTGDIFVGIQARAVLSTFGDLRVPYALAVTLEMAQPVRQDLNTDVVARIMPKTKLPARVRVPVRS
jgi:hypothetical protein